MFRKLIHCIDRYANVIPAVVVTFLSVYILYVIGVNVESKSVPYAMLAVIICHAASGIFALNDDYLNSLTKPFTFAIVFVICIVILVYIIISWPFLPTLLILSIFGGAAEYLLLQPEKI